MTAMHVVIVEAELRAHHPPQWDNQMARHLAVTQPYVLTVAVHPSRGRQVMPTIEAVIMATRSADALRNDVTERIITKAAATIGPDLLRARLTVGTETLPTQWEWMTDATEIAARTAYRVLHPRLTDYERLHHLPVLGLRDENRGAAGTDDHHRAIVVYVPDRPTDFLTRLVACDLRLWSHQRPALVPPATPRPSAHPEPADLSVASGLEP